MGDRTSIHAVLCHPQDSRNVGAAIRAVANHGLGSLRIVTEIEFDPEDLFFFSSGSIEVTTVELFADLDSAIADCGQIIGTSRRTRDPLAPPFWPAAGLPHRLMDEGEVAILFGTERTGLTREEVDRCSALVWVPTTEAFPSMNLGHAVAVIGYELARPTKLERPAQAVAAPRRTPAPAREALYAHMEEVAAELGYPPGRNPELFTRKLRRILERANLDQAEYSLVAGVFTEMRRLARLADPKGE